MSNKIKCIVCGEYFEPKQKRSQICSRKCVQRHQYLSLTKPKRHDKNSGLKYNCVVCGKEFSSHRKDAKCCSLECSVTVGAKARGKQLALGVNPANIKKYIHEKKYSLVCFKECFCCGKWFRSIGLSKCCSDVCQRTVDDIKKKRQTARQRFLKAYDFNSKRIVCKECGKEYVTQYGDYNRTVFCSHDCCEKNGARNSRHKRRAQKYGSTYEQINNKKVFARDKWTCQLCGIKTLKSKRGTVDGRAPELDHIIPLSKGGSHTYRNVQCSCRSCNGKKAGTIKGQLRIC